MYDQQFHFYPRLQFHVTALSILINFEQSLKYENDRLFISTVWVWAKRKSSVAFTNSCVTGVMKPLWNNSVIQDGIFFGPIFVFKIL